MIEMFGIMGLTIRRELTHTRNPHTRPMSRLLIHLLGVNIPVIKLHKLLGVIIDQELCWREQVDYVLQKGVKWVKQYCTDEADERCLS